jgi:hypothetical protein
MSTEEPGETAVRIAALSSTVMNLAAIVDDDPASLDATERGELRSTLLWAADELGWVGTIAGSVAGLSWPSDGQDRIERLRTIARAWDPLAQPPPEVLEAARECIRMLLPSALNP